MTRLGPGDRRRLGMLAMLAINLTAAGCAKDDAGATCTDLGSELGEAVASGSSWEGDWSLDCRGAGHGQAFTWTAPSEGCWRFDTTGSQADTVLGVFDDSCGGAALVCDDDGGDDLDSAAQVVLAAGQSVTVVVDRYDAYTSGAFSLNVSACDDSRLGELVDLGSAIGSPVVTGDTSGYASDIDVSCGDMHNDIVYRWHPPEYGRWVFDTDGSDFDTVLAILDPADHAELACNDDISNGVQASHTWVLYPDEEVLIVIGGYTAGAYELDIWLGDG